ncbi:MAG: AtpZ/AtpI family protein [Oceanospirillaceae bacterium]|nr:AtpZ/AtpI family protein [Oceanospirillaceae bacterium]MCP5335176.1 AtpZ/AtpI family protein [Oceanospirillaceae bacterium]MCP5351513.1 AtpZ/AtpI family protein [Oceanospirillaceae bacterium]
MKTREKFRASVISDAQRQRKFLSQRAGLFGFLVYGGTLGLLLVLPMVAGAYLGSWLDAQMAGYSTRWTVSLIILGIVAGIWNVIWYIRGHE